MEQAERIRVKCGAATGAAGLAVAVAMTVAGGSLARFLPDGPLFHAVAFVGAAVAGAALADGFGRRGRLGALAAIVAAPVVTAVGAVIATLLLVAIFEPSGGWRALSGAVPLGVLAVTDGIGTSPFVAGTWGLSLAGVHMAMRRVRGLPLHPFKPL
ncbi:hypothetical protein [uncultured Tateyamaria sp.]|uniref:hypothetical protein n=1 Tax=Tateyamaria sp. 1078 TaxID=3417464 RepID=UPI00261779AE|nr:hypothetical protein [uncultured Tateyamaria sp.]